MTSRMNFDVVVVGGSAAGCATAALFGRHGLRVALLEQHTDPFHFKKVCTHSIMAVGLEAMRKIGLDKKIEAAGGRRNDLELWTPWGWIRAGDPSKMEFGYNIRRQTLDPILRNLTAATPGVSFFVGMTARALIRDARGRITGVAATDHEGQREFVAPLVVAADGRLSRLAELAGVKANQHENKRFTYYTYYRDLEHTSSAGTQEWYLGEHLANVMKNDDGVTLVSVCPAMSKLEDFKRDPMRAFLGMWERMPDGPRLGKAKPITELRGQIKCPTHWRPSSAPGIAFVGDAAMTIDPIWGTGCGFAFASANWLVEATAPAFGARADIRQAIDRGLKSYRKKHRAQTWAHYAHTSSFAQVRGLLMAERLLYQAAARDSHVARRVLSYVGRTLGPTSLLGPSSLAQAVLVNLKYALFGWTNLETPETLPFEQPRHAAPQLPHQAGSRSLHGSLVTQDR